MQNENPEEINDTTEVRRSFALTTSRIESLSDCIFAFAMTLLVLGFSVPAQGSGSSLLRALIRLQPQFTTYILSFVVLGGLWLAHHNQYFWIKKSNRPFLWINMMYLLFISLIPFSTKVLAEYPDQSVAMIIYGLNVVICLTVLYIHWFYATRKKIDLVENLNDRIVILVEGRIGALIFLNILAVILSFVSLTLGVWMIIIAQVFLVAPTVTIDKLIIRYKRSFSKK